LGIVGNIRGRGGKVVGGLWATLGVGGCKVVGGLSATLRVGAVRLLGHFPQH